MAASKVTSNNNVISQWVKNVTGFSSQYNSDSWGANQVIGQPKVYPRYGDIHGAWAQGTRDANQFLELEYEKAVYVTGVDIYETLNAGGTKRILAKDATGKWRTLWETGTVTLIKSSRIFSPPLHQLNLKTKFLRVEIDCTVAGSWVELDAIQMRGIEFNIDTFDIEGLKTFVSGNSIQKIDSSNAVEVYLSATKYLHFMEELKSRCLNYMSSHLNEVSNSSSFVDLPQQTMLEIIQLTSARLSL